MLNPWAMKMEQYTRFSDEERCELDTLIGEGSSITARAKTLSARAIIHPIATSSFLDWPAVTKSCRPAGARLWLF